METPKKSSVIGTSLILFGVIFFLRAMGVIDADNVLLSPKMYPLYAAAVFFVAKQNNYAIGCLILSGVVWFEDIYRLLNEQFKIIWPLALVVVGVLLVSGKLNSKNKRLNENNRKEEENEGDGKPFKLQ